jgi:hypothetical protein
LGLQFPLPLEEGEVQEYFDLLALDPSHIHDGRIGTCMSFAEFELIDEELAIWLQNSVHNVGHQRMQFRKSYEDHPVSFAQFSIFEEFYRLLA